MTTKPCMVTAHHKGHKMANCPKCATQELHAGLMSPGLPALVCTSCNGALVSLISYRAWREGENLTISPAPNPDTAVLPGNNSIACLCPKCRALMSKYRFSQHTDNHLDYCAHCQEVWFDHGEWALIEELELNAQLTQIFTRPWQYEFHQQKIKDESTARWKARLGPDFEKLQETKRWLDTHPNKQLMVAYLTTNKR